MAIRHNHALLYFLQIDVLTDGLQTVWRKICYSQYLQGWFEDVWYVKMVGYCCMDKVRSTVWKLLTSFYLA